IKKDDLGWTAAGGIEARNVQAAVNLAQTDYEVNGPISTNIKLNYSYSKNKLTIEPFSASLNATQLFIRHGQILSKPASIPLILETNGRLDSDYLTVNSLRLQLSKLQTNATARWPMGDRAVPFQ